MSALTTVRGWMSECVVAVGSPSQRECGMDRSLKWVQVPGGQGAARTTFFLGACELDSMRASGV